MKSVYSDYLNDIFGSMEFSQNFIQGHTLPTFREDDKNSIRCDLMP